MLEVISFLFGVSGVTSAVYFYNEAKKVVSDVLSELESPVYKVTAEVNGEFSKVVAYVSKDEKEIHDWVISESAKLGTQLAATKVK